MSNGTFLKLPHKIDVYTKTISVNAAGQRATTYTKAGTVQALYQAMSSERRTYPYTDNIDEIEFYISYKDLVYASYSNRIINVVDRYGNVIEVGPVEIVNIHKQIGLNGKVRQILLTCRKVVENA
jgi:uncharacterized protein YneR